MLDGPVSIGSSDVGPIPHAFDIVFTLDTPFFYDPSQGDLLLQVNNLDPQDIADPFDAFSGTGDTRVFRVNKTTNGIDNIGLVTKFSGAKSVPDGGGTVSLLFLGMMSLISARKLTDWRTLRVDG